MPTAHDSSDEAAVKAAQKHARWKAHRERQDLRYVLRKPEGRRWLEGVLRASGVWDEAPLDPVLRDRFEGKRSLGLALLKDIRRLDPEAEMLMRAEYDLVPEQGSGDAPEA